jgi:hypothetical protein
MSKDDNEYGIFPFLQDIVKDRLRDFYHAIAMATENALNIIDDEPIYIKNFHGNHFAESGMRQFRSWMMFMQGIATSNNIFQKQFLEPARCAAHFVVNIRKLDEHTVKVTGFVFSKSHIFSDTNEKGEKVFSARVGLIIPEIDAITQIKINDEDLAKEIEVGRYYEISKIEPIPYVNRSYNKSLKFIKIEKAVSLREFGFLKATMRDMEKFSSTVAFENFCALSSNESKKRTYLGAPLIFSGRVASYQHPNIQVIEEKSGMLGNFTLYSDAKINCNIQIGGHVRILASVWYVPTQDANAPANPEVCYIESVEGADEAVLDEAAGYIRTRGAVSITEYEKEFGKNTPFEIIRDGDTYRFSFKENHAEYVLQEYLNCANKIRTLRYESATSDTLLVQSDEIVSEKDLFAQNIAMRLRKHRLEMEIVTHAARLSDLQFVFRKEELMDAIRNDNSVEYTDEEYLDFKIRYVKGWLKMIEQNKWGWRISKKGIEVLSIMFRDDPRIATSGQMSLDFDSGQRIDIPTVQMKLLEDQGMEALDDSGAKCKIFWNKPGLNYNADEFMGQIRDLCDNIVRLVENQQSRKSNRYGIFSDIKDNKALETDYFSVSHALDYLADKKLIENVGDDNFDMSYEMALTNFLRRVKRFVPTSRLVSKVKKPGIQKEIEKEIGQIMTDKAGKGEVTTITGPQGIVYWGIFEKDGEEKLAKRTLIKDRMKSVLRNYTKHAKDKSQVYASIMSELKRHWRDEAGDQKGLEELAETILNELEGAEFFRVSESMYTAKQ